MSDKDLPDDVKRQAEEAARNIHKESDAPGAGPPIKQSTPDAPQDASGMADAYNVPEQEALRAEKREQAITYRDAAPEPQGQETRAPEGSVSTPVGGLNQSGYDAALEAGRTLKNAETRQEITAASADATPKDAAPSQELSLEPTPAPDAPEPDRE